MLKSHQHFFRPGMGTEKLAPFLKSMVEFIRPSKILEVGAGYTTPFLIDAIKANKVLINEGNLYPNILQRMPHDSRVFTIDDFEDKAKLDEYRRLEKENSDFFSLYEGKFQDILTKEFCEKNGPFDFVYFDCGGSAEYLDFCKNCLNYCSGIVIFHFTFTNGMPNGNKNIIDKYCTKEYETISLLEPHKYRQGSVTIIRRIKS